NPFEAINPFEALFGRQLQQPQLPPQATAYANPNDEEGELRAELRRQIVNYPSNEAPGTIIVDTPNTYLYLVLGGGKAMRYGIGVGREGFTWSGVKTIERKAEWPDWTPPPEMIQRQPYLPRFVAGGASNPLGARAMYLSGSVYRIHGTNAPSTIGGRVSSGCIRMVNEDVIDLYNRAHVGSKVIVLPMSERRAGTSPSGIYGGPSGDAASAYETPALRGRRFDFVSGRDAHLPFPPAAAAARARRSFSARPAWRGWRESCALHRRRPPPWRNRGISARSAPATSAIAGCRWHRRRAAPACARP